MAGIVFLNAEKVDYDHTLDFSELRACGRLTLYGESAPETIPARVAGQEIVITKELPIGAELIAAFPESVRLICEAGTGYNNIDLRAAAAKGIRVCNVPAYSTGAVAQLTIALLLDLCASLSRQQRMLAKRDYRNFTHALSAPHVEAAGKTLGVIGAGAIGRQVLRVARALDMRALVCTRTPRTWDDPGIVSAPLDRLLRESDFISIHCPLTPETHHLLDTRAFAAMKPTAYVINTSRGAVIDEQALIGALRSGQIAGAALDVQEHEPLSPDSPLFTMENVVLTPHTGWKCAESRQRLLGVLAENIRAFLRDAPVNLVS